MAQIAKVECQTDIKSCANQFFDVFRSKAFLIPKFCPGKIKSIQLCQGGWNSVGSVKIWTYATGKTEKTKEIVEAVDEQNNSITCRAIEGDLLNDYKTMKTTCQVTPNSTGSSVKWTIEYEKMNECVPTPDKYLAFMTIVTKEIDAYLIKTM